MAILPEVFNSNDHEPMSDFEPIPPNLYLMEIVKSEIKENSKKTGSILKFQMKVIDQDSKQTGRLVFVDLNLVNPNKECVEIAQRQLTSICNACGVESVEDSTELHGIPFGAKVAIKPGEGTYPPKNVIKKYFIEDEMPEDYEPELKED